MYLYEHVAVLAGKWIFDSVICQAQKRLWLSAFRHRQTHKRIFLHSVNFDLAAQQH